MKTQKGTDNTRMSVTIVKADVDAMKAAVSIRCLDSVFWPQYEATGVRLKIIPTVWEIVTAMLMKLMIYYRRAVSLTLQ